MNKNNWIFVKDKLPEPGKIVIISDGRSVTPGFRNPKDDNAFYYIIADYSGICYVIPHLWQPLPELPKKDLHNHQPL